MREGEKIREAGKEEKGEREEEKRGGQLNRMFVGSI